jgi:hypothetical protein
MRRVDFLALTVFVSSLIACSPAPGNGSGVGDGGGDEGGGSGGVPLGGSAGTAAAGQGGMIIQGGAAGGGGTGNVCQELTVETKPVTPTVLILVDNSSSMFEPRADLWDALFNALMVADGPVDGLQAKIRFGFASYKGIANNGQPVATSETDPACAEVAEVTYALDNYAAINDIYTMLGTQWMPGVKWETPTGHAITRVVPGLRDFVADPPGPKIILLVTDGNPNTCRVLDPQCGQDQTIKAVQDAYAAGIGTVVLGIGDIVGANTGCVPAQMRCGVNHLQDIANAGQGQPVVQPPAEYVYQQCVAGPAGGAGTLTATYSPAGGTAMPLTATNAAAIAPALEGLLTGFVSCTLDMNALVTGNPALGTVIVTPTEGPNKDQVRPIMINDMTDGWVLEDNRFQVTLTGQACEDYKIGAKVDIAFPCEVAEPR